MISLLDHMDKSDGIYIPCILRSWVTYTNLAGCSLRDLKKSFTHSNNVGTCKHKVQCIHIYTIIIITQSKTYIRIILKFSHTIICMPALNTHISRACTVKWQGHKFDFGGFIKSCTTKYALLLTTPISVQLHMLEPFIGKGQWQINWCTCL